MTGSVRRLVLSALCVLAITSHPFAQANDAKDDDASIARRVRAHVEFLASDLLQGRDAVSSSFDIAARYITTQLELLGMQPGGDSNTFLQAVPLVEAKLVTSRVAVSRPGQSAEVLQSPDQVAVAPDPAHQKIDVEAPVVFVGYGITAPALNYDDYADVDVKGKIALFFSNAPSQFSSEQRAHFASTDLKLKNAAEHGAVGVVTMLLSDELSRTPWDRIARRIIEPKVTWVDSAGQPGTGDARLRGRAAVSPDGAAKLFAGSSMTLADAEAAAKAGQHKSVALPVRLSIATESEHRPFTGHNVVAMLPGSDPELAKTYVVLSAHLDHIGIGKPVNGDSINNGAYDNATGCAFLLEAARDIVRGPRPKRSLLILFVTAEEKGLIGSDYFARHPTVAGPQIVADVNLDMPVLMWPMSDVIAFGAENSTLGAVVQRAASKVGLKVVPDPMPEETIFVRSDQYSFVKQGVPAAYLMPGFGSRDPAVNGREVFEKFLHTHYHQPSDDLSLPMDTKSAADFLRVNELIISSIANDPVAPTWLPGNFFGTTFAPHRTGE